MCKQCSNIPSVTLQTAVLMQVKDFAKDQTTFSVYDITSHIREKTSNGVIEIPEVEVSGASFRFDIPHTKVKSIFDELWRTSVFDPLFTLTRNFNGRYFEYTPTSVAVGDCPPTIVPDTHPSSTPIYPGGTSNSVPVAMVTRTSHSSPVSRFRGDSVFDSVFMSRIKIYLLNCCDIGVDPTIKQIQSAIKRKNDTKSWTCYDIREYVKSIRFVISSDSDCISLNKVNCTK